MKRFTIVFPVFIIAGFVACQKQNPLPPAEEQQVSVEVVYQLPIKMQAKMDEFYSKKLVQAEKYKKMALHKTNKTRGIAAKLSVPSTTYPTIQSAVDAAFPGDKIEVAAGIYSENVFITTPGIRLTAQNAGLTQIYGGIHIWHTSRVQVQGFAVINGGPYGSGIDIWNADRVRVSHNTVHGAFYGIWLGVAENCVVKNNLQLDNNTVGYYSTAAHNNLIKGNRMRWNDWDGVLTFHSHGNSFKTNICDDNNHSGFVIIAGDYNTGDNNSCTANAWDGFVLADKANNNYFSKCAAYDQGCGVYMSAETHDNTFRKFVAIGNDAVVCDNGEGNYVD